MKNVNLLKEGFHVSGRKIIKKEPLVSENQLFLKPILLLDNEKSIIKKELSQASTNKNDSITLS